MKRILCVILFFVSVAAQADFLESGQKALNAGNYKQAVNDLNKYLDRNPNNAEARFSKGLALVMLQQDDDAIQVFSDLVRDYPELPEPYNNLAVLYARAGRYDEARDALESALVTHPSYATAHENLGDIYAALANAAYNRAIVLDKNNPAVRNKQELVAQLINLDASTVPPVQVAATKPQAEQQPAQAPRNTAPSPAAIQTRPKPTAAPNSIVATGAAPSAAVATNTGPANVYDIPDTFSTEPVLPGGAVSAPSNSVSALDKRTVLGRIEAWRKAWSDQDPDAYLANYSPNFVPTSGLSRSAWETQRRTRVVRPRSILIQVLQPQVSAEPNGQIRVDFTQIYESNTYSDQVRKRMILEQVNGTWMILKESVVG